MANTMAWLVIIGLAIFVVGIAASLGFGCLIVWSIFKDKVR